MYSLVSNFDGCCRSHNYNIKGLCVFFVDYFTTISVVTKKKLFLTDESLICFSPLFMTLAYIEFIIFVENEK